jgi:hypothetical protein
MCDYSLMAIHNRLAVEGDQLVAHPVSERLDRTGVVVGFHQVADPAA